VPRAFPRRFHVADSGLRLPCSAHAGSIKALQH
jgi:hypothetical protein